MVNKEKIIKEVRIEILDFAYDIEIKMREHDRIKGDSYKKCSIFYLYEKLIEEYREFINEYQKPYEKNKKDKLRNENLDLSAICMMINYYLKK